MSDVLVIASRAGEIVYAPPIVLRAARERAFLRALPSALAALWREGVRDGASSFVPGTLMRDALRAWSAFVDDEARSVPGERELAWLSDARGARVEKARVRTAFDDEPGVRWSDRLHGPLTGRDAWRDVSEGAPRGEIEAMLGAVDTSTDGSIVRPGHVLRRGRPPRYATREERVTIRFVTRSSFPPVLELIAWVEGRITAELRFARG